MQGAGAACARDAGLAPPSAPHCRPLPLTLVRLQRRHPTATSSRCPPAPAPPATKPAAHSSPRSNSWSRASGMAASGCRQGAAGAGWLRGPQICAGSACRPLAARRQPQAAPCVGPPHPSPLRPQMACTSRGAAAPRRQGPKPGTLPCCAERLVDRLLRRQPPAPSSAAAMVVGAAAPSALERRWKACSERIAAEGFEVSAGELEILGRWLAVNVQCRRRAGRAG